ncbi:oligosaccharide flippase family protein [Edwardsiella tarda]|uniref:oligosaccharide flippase family protein n=1 Tax=Edwardsiella tarda TaxID=636 RepID=UPI003D2F151A
MEKTLLKNIFSMFSIQGINYLIPLITVPYLVRVLGLDGFGKYSIILAVIQYLVILTDYGFSLSASRQISLNIGNKKVISQIFCAIICCKIVISLLLFLTLSFIILHSTTYKGDFWLFFNGFGIVIGASFFPVWLYQGYEKMHWIAVSNFIAKISGLLMIFLFVRNRGDINLAIMVQSYAGMIAAAFAFFEARRGDFIYFIIPTLQDIKKQLKMGWSIFLSTFFVSMYTTSIPLILGFNAGAEAVGIYNSADKLKQALQGIIGPVSQAIYPRSNRLMMDSLAQGVRFVNRVSVILISGMFLLSVVCYWMADYIVFIAFGPEHLSSVDVFKIIVWIPPIVALANMLGIQIMLPLGLNKQFGLVYVIIGTIGLPLMFITSYFYSFIGVSYASLSLEIIIVSIFSYIVFKKVKGKL